MPFHNNVIRYREVVHANVFERITVDIEGASSIIGLNFLLLGIVLMCWSEW